MSTETQKLLFDSKEAAKEVSFALRGKWDGCNSIEIIQPTVNPDIGAFFLALQLAGGKYCFERDICSFPQTYPAPRRTFISVQEPLEFLASVDSNLMFGCSVGIFTAIFSSYQQCLPPAKSTY